MVIMVLFLMFLQPAVDSTSNQNEPYQNLNFEITDTGFNATFDPSRGTIYLYHKRDRTVISFSEHGTVDTVGTIPQNFEALEKMDITRSGESIYFWENGIGRVHRYDIQSGTMVREDTSHPHRTMFSHAPFLSDEPFIYAIGGYGYWEMRNFLIRYEPAFGQWEKLPAKNNDIVIRSWRGLLYKIDNSFYYFVDNAANSNSGKTRAYRFDTESSTWHNEHDLEQVFESFSILKRNRISSFAQNPTYMVDKNNRHLGFLSSSFDDNFLNLVSIDESVIYKLNLDDYGINDVRAVFYSDRINQWVILGHEYPLHQRRILKAFLFKFDENHSFITVHRADFGLPAQAYILTAGGTITLGLIGFFLYFMRRNKYVKEAEDAAPSGHSSQKPVTIFKNDDDTISVFIHGNRFRTAEDQALNELWVIISEMVKSGESYMLVSNIDQRIYSNQSHPSYNSRNRKKLLNIINTACGFELLSEERSKIDKRYKVLTIQMDKITFERS